MMPLLSLRFLAKNALIQSTPHDEDRTTGEGDRLKNYLNLSGAESNRGLPRETFPQRKAGELGSVQE
jgi:hypothetical protein